ncbi:MAG TPA: alpha/beta hydrolase [Sumerlaeia bacterium]|nr:alpha/beta hydrolase [Sumerlaeia bacterium]
MNADAIPLWPGGAPDAVDCEPADGPSLTPHFPDPRAATGAAMIVCPGGGYEHLAEHEGAPVAEWLASLGIAAFVLRYRTAPRYRHPAPLLDAQRAIKTVRSRAAAMSLDSHRVGILGFSAGGHLASSAATLFDPGDPDSDDPIERWASRPDAVILIYPVISMLEHGNEGCRDNLLGPLPEAPEEEPEAGEDEEEDARTAVSPKPLDETPPEDNLIASIRRLRRETLSAQERAKDRQGTRKKGKKERENKRDDLRKQALDSLSTHKQVTSETPAAFIVHAATDPVVSCENSLLFARALREAGVPCELHLYEEGPHGFGLAVNHPLLRTWTGLCARWLQLRGFAGRMGA